MWPRVPAATSCGSHTGLPMVLPSSGRAPGPVPTLHPLLPHCLYLGAQKTGVTRPLTPHTNVAQMVQLTQSLAPSAHHAHSFSAPSGWAREASLLCGHRLIPSASPGNIARELAVRQVLNPAPDGTRTGCVRRVSVVVSWMAQGRTERGPGKSQSNVRQELFPVDDHGNN